MRTTSTRAQRAALALKVDRIDAEMTAQRTLISHLIVLLDKHDWELQHYRATACAIGVKR